MKRIIDNRKKEKFMIDDEYLNGMARLVGHQGTLVYFSLCRHANKDQECFPSISLMSKELAVSTDTIKRGIKKLKERNVIEVGKKRTKSGTWLNNTYTLLDKGVWNYVQGANSTVVNQGANSTISRVQNCPIQGANSTTKETHRKETHRKETHILAKASFAGKEINEVMDEFKKLNPLFNFGNTTQRKATEELLKKFGKENLIAMIQKYIKEVSNNKYVPKATTPYQFKSRLGDIVLHFKNKGSIGSRIIEADK